MRCAADAQCTHKMRRARRGSGWGCWATRAGVSVPERPSAPVRLCVPGPVGVPRAFAPRDCMARRASSFLVTADRGARYLSNPTAVSIPGAPALRRSHPSAPVIRAGVFFDLTPAYRRTALSMRPSPFRRFLPRPPASALSPPITPCRRAPSPRDQLYPEGSTDYVPQKATTRVGRRGVWRGELRLRRAGGAPSGSQALLGAIPVVTASKGI